MSVSGLEEVVSDQWFSSILLLMGSSLPVESGCFTDTRGERLEPESFSSGSMSIASFEIFTFMAP